MKKYFIIAISCLLLVNPMLRAQQTDALGTYTPYSMFGLGEKNGAGLSYNKAMGGIGIGLSNNRNINVINPAGLAIDTLSFMLDIAVKQNNFYSKSQGKKSAYNIMNMDHIVIGMPLYKSLGMSLELSEYSNIGYKFLSYEDRQDFVAEIGNVTYQNYGRGGLYNIALGLGTRVNKNFAAGVSIKYIFGNLGKYADVDLSANQYYTPIKSGSENRAHAIGLKLGLQYRALVLTDKLLTVGATYSPKVNLNGNTYDFSHATYSTGYVDTIYNYRQSSPHLSIPSEFGFGLSLRSGDKWTIGADFTYQDWSKAKLPEIFGNAINVSAYGISFKSTKSNAIRLGFEYTPDRYSVRYFLNRVTYRGGLYREQTYMNVNGNNVVATGITFGVNVPVSKYYNSIGFAIDLGQRGKTGDGLVRERYVKFVIDFTLHEMWFVKQRYE